MTLEVTLEVTPEYKLLIEKLQALCGLSEQEIIREALLLFGWAVREAAEGYQIGSIDEAHKNYRELRLSSIDRARRKTA